MCYSELYIFYMVRQESFFNQTEKKISQKNNEQKIQSNGDVEDLSNQKVENFKTLLNYRLILLKNFDDIEVKWSLYWTLKHEVLRINSEITKLISEGQDTEELESELIKQKIALKNCKYVVFHDIFDHVLNGNAIGSYLSDWNVPIASNLIDEDAGTFYRNILTTSDAMDFEFLAEEIADVNLTSKQKKDCFHLDIINQLPETEKEKILTILSHLDLNQKIHTLQTNDYKKILTKMAEIFIRGQVFRGLLSLEYLPYNKAFLERIKTGQPINNDPELQEIWLYCSNQVTILNNCFQSNPTAFNSYEDYYQNYKPNPTLNYRGNLEVKEMRNRMQTLILEIMDDPLMEKLVKEAFLD